MAHTPHPSLIRERLRTIALFSLLVGAGILATGCSSKPSATAGGSSTGPVLVRIWRVGQPEDVIKDQIQTFITKNGGPNVIQVTYDERDPATYELDALESLSAQEGPDIWSIENDWIGDHIPQITPLPANYFYPRDNNGVKETTGTSPADEVKQLYPAGIADQLIGTDGSSVYGLPSAVDSLKLYVNTSLLTDAFQNYEKSLGDGATAEQITPVQQLLSAPPATWLDLTQQEKYINQISNGTINEATIALGTADNIQYSNDILQLLMMQNGAQIVSTDRRNALFQIPATTASGSSVVPGQLALDFFTSFSNPSSSSYDWNPSMPDDLDAFGQGKVAMIIGYSDIAAQLKVKYPKLDFTVAPVPQISATGTPVNLIKFTVETVTKTANNTAAAFAFLNDYTDPSSISNLASQENLLSPYLSTLNQNPTDPFVQQVLTGQAVYKKSHTQFDAAFRQMIVDVSQDGIPSDQALDQGAESITELLQNDTSP